MAADKSLNKGQTNVQIGQSGDFLTAAVLAGFGVDCDVVNKVGFDILARHADKWIRVEVKSTRARQRDRRCYSWKTCSGNNKKIVMRADRCDIVALAALDVRKVVFRPISEIKSMTTHIFEHVLIESDERQTWEESCRKI